MHEIEPQSVRSHERSCLFDMATKNLPERGVQEMSRGVVSPGCVACRDVDLGGNQIALPKDARADKDAVQAWRPGGGALLATAADFGLDYAVVRTPSGPQATRTVNHSRLGEALLHLAGPPLKALFVASNNPAVTCPDAGAVRRGLLREDLFTVVHDPFLSDTARYADLVLPAATYLETEDIFRAYGTYYLQRSAAVLPPRGEAWSNLRLAQTLARRLGLTDPVFSMSVDELIAALFRRATGPVAEIDPALGDEGRAEVPVANEVLHDHLGRLGAEAGDAQRDLIVARTDAEHGRRVLRDDHWDRVARVEDEPE